MAVLDLRIGLHMRAAVPTAFQKMTVQTQEVFPMTYEQALEWIHSTPRFGQVPGLSRIYELTARLGLPQNRFPCVHIAGTNGKGSTAAMTASILQAAGYKTALFTSPYLEDFRERMRINGALIPQAELAQLADLVRSASRQIALTEFELVTAIGLMWFAQQGCDIAVLEVGLGGRFDATNIIPPPLAAVITSISLDHTQVLGDTVEQIAMEKAGILKSGSRAVLSPNQPAGVEPVVRHVCTERNIPLVCPPPLPGPEEDGTCTPVLWQNRLIRLPLLGTIQRSNAAAALAAVELLRDQGWDIPDQAVVQGLESVRWPGRMELFRREPPILLDCAHNPDALDRLSRWVQVQFGRRPVSAVMGMLSDKDHQAGIQAIAAQCRRFYAAPPPSPRALDPEKAAAEAVKAGAKAVACSSVEEAVRLALAELEPDGALLVCGSIPLVGAARKTLASLL